MKVVYYNRQSTPGNFSIERVFQEVREALPHSLDLEDFFWDPKHRLRSLLDASRCQGDVNHITGHVHFLALSLVGERTLLTVHDLGHFEHTLRGIKKRVYGHVWLEKPFRKVKMITTVSEFTRQTILEHFPFCAGRIEVIHNPAPRSFAFAPREFNADKPRILQIGSGLNKNLDRLIDAISGIDCELVLIRKPDVLIQRKLQHRWIDHTFHYNLTASEIYDKYVSCDIVYFASTHEGFGLPIVEANAVGRPIIVGNVTAMPEIAGGSAYVVDPYSVDSIRKAVLDLKNEESLRVDLINKGRENIKRFEPGVIARQYVELYEAICDGH